MALISCSECGKEFSNKADKCPTCGCPTIEASVVKEEPLKNEFESLYKGTFKKKSYIQEKKQKKLVNTGFKTGRLVIGIFSIIFSFVILFQASTAGLVNIINSTTNDHSGLAGIALFIIFLGGGITLIATRNSDSINGPRIAAIIYLIGTIIANHNSDGIYKDLKVWGIVSIFFGIISIASLRKEK